MIEPTRVMTLTDMRDDIREQFEKLLLDIGIDPKRVVQVDVLSTRSATHRVILDDDTVRWI